MNKQIEALKMAIEALEGIDECYWEHTVLQACKEALAEAESESSSQPVAFNGKEYMEGFNAGKMFAELEHTAQKPVAYIKEVGEYGIIDFAHLDEDGAYPVYTHPATWQSLSDDEIAEVIKKAFPVVGGITNVDLKFARAIEQALKEKNT